MNHSARLCNVRSWISRPKRSLVHRISPHIHTTYTSSPSTRFCPFPNPNINVYYYLSIRRRHHVTLSSCRASACNQPPTLSHPILPNHPPHPSLPIHSTQPQKPNNNPLQNQNPPARSFFTPYLPTYPPTYLPSAKTPPPSLPPISSCTSPRADPLARNRHTIPRAVVFSSLLPCL